MSVKLLLLYSFAMIAAIIANTTPVSAGMAHIVCACSLVGFAAMIRVEGLRKPVV